MDRIAVTGYGLKAPGISNSADFKEVLENGTCTQQIVCDQGPNNASIVAGVVDEDLTRIRDWNYKRYTRSSRLAMAAADEAWDMANLEVTERNTMRIAVIMGTSAGGILELDQYAESSRDIKTFPLQGVSFGDVHTLSSSVSYHLGTKGQSYTITTGCASSADAILMGKILLDTNQADACIVGGSDASISQWGTFSFAKLRSILTNSAINETGVPFSKNHKGFVMSEGAGVLILEKERNARLRGVEIKGYIDNAYSNNEASPLLTSDPSGESMLEAMTMVLQGKTPTYVNSQALGLTTNDEVEHIVHKALFGMSVPITSIKGMIGHTFGSAGAIQVISSLLSMEYGFIPPTIKTTGAGFDDIPIQFQLDYKPVDSVAITTHGNGGNNTCILISNN